MIWARSEGELFRDYCCSSNKAQEHVLTLSWTGGDFELDWLGSTRGPVIFQELSRFLGNFCVCFLVRGRLEGMVDRRDASDLRGGKQWA